jgi:hypothetical protein
MSIQPEQFRFFLDSGAYSAWSQGAVIDLDEYCEFIRRNIEVIDVYACLDCIPGAPGKITTPKMREEAAEITWSNYLYMKAQGLDPLPVYHYGEDPKFLQRMLDYGCEYIGIGGLVGISSENRRAWLDRVFATICDAEGHPRVKTHGFGMTALPLVFRYPWYSVDSTSWLITTKNGAVYLPAVDGEGNFRFDTTPTPISVSSRNPRVTEAGKHISSLGVTAKTQVMKWLDICGVTLEQVADDYYYRAVCNVTFFRMVSEAKLNKPFKPSERSQKRFF